MAKIKAVNTSGNIMEVRLDTDTDTVILLDMATFLENGRKFCDFDPAELMASVQTDGETIWLCRGGEKFINIPWQDFKAIVFSDTEAISEKIFMQAPGASMQQQDLDRLELACSFLSRKGIYTKIQSVSTSGNIIRVQMSNTARAVIQLDLTLFLKCGRKYCSFDPDEVIRGLKAGGMKIYVLRDHDVLTEIYWTDLYKLTLHGDSKAVSAKVFQTMAQKERLRSSSKPLSNRDQGGRP